VSDLAEKVLTMSDAAAEERTVFANAHDIATREWNQLLHSTQVALATSHKLEVIVSGELRMVLDDIKELRVRLAGGWIQDRTDRRLIVIDKTDDWRCPLRWAVAKKAMVNSSSGHILQAQ